MSVDVEATVEHQTAVDLYRQMARIRRFEQRAYRGYEQGHVYGTVHVSNGQEAVAVGVIGALRPDDQVISHHRGHGHALAKGVDPGRLMAELYARTDGVSGGKGGSMHATSVEHGFLGTMAIVGSAIPLAAGVALANKRLGNEKVCVAFFGDGAINQGVLYESLNLAALLELPVVFVCENNGYAITTSASDSTAGPGLVDRGRAFGLTAEQVDGQDVVEVGSVASRLVERARSGGGPSVIEALTYRFMGHSRGDPTHGVYRSAEELETWKARDPMLLIARRGGLSEADCDGLDTEVDAEIDAAVNFALHSDVPGPDMLTVGVTQ